MEKHPPSLMVPPNKKIIHVSIGGGFSISCLGGKINYSETWWKKIFVTHFDKYHLKLGLKSPIILTWPMAKL